MGLVCSPKIIARFVLAFFPGPKKASHILHPGYESSSSILGALFSASMYFQSLGAEFLSESGIGKKTSQGSLVCPSEMGHS